jgi:pyrroline-5-carboxylate reductase
MKTAAVIGCGKMGAALVKGMLRAGVLAPGDLRLHDVSRAALEGLAAEAGARAADSAEDAARGADVALVCVKPGEVAGLLEGLRPTLAGKLAVSIAAGVPLSRLQTAAGDACRVARVMPNTPALIGRGVAAYALGEGATESDAADVERIFGSVGRAFRVKEGLLDAVTALSGSGPAYVFLVIEALADAGVAMGLSKDLALELAAGTVAGSAEMIAATGEHPARLRDMVTSPGGTTIAGVEALEKAGVRAAFFAALRAAARRSAELGAS